MRITQGMMMSKYQKSLTSNLSRLSDDSDKISSEKAFTKGSQDPVAAMKVLKASHKLSNVTQYQESVSETSSWVSATESAVTTVNKILVTASGTALAAKNGTNSTASNQSYAAALTNDQQEILQALNSSFNGQYIFGGGKSETPPFKIGTATDLTSSMDSSAGVTFTSDQVDGKLLFNVPNTDKYVPVSVINNLTDTTNAYYKYSINNPDMKYSMPVDLGLGVQVSGGVTVAGSAFDASTSALDFLCQDFTVNGSGVPSCTNIIDTMGDSAAKLTTGDSSQIDTLISSINNTQDGELKSTVFIGEKSKMLDFLSDKLTTDNTNLQSMISEVQDTESVAAYSNYMVSQAVYQASLSISSSVLQHSLIDFLK